MTSAEHVEVWRESSGAWRWRYVGTDADGERVELPANSPEESCERAVSAARVAYPDLAVQVLTPPEQAAPLQDSGRRRVPRSAALVLLVAGVGAARQRWGAVAMAALVAGLLVVRRHRHRR